MTDVPVSPAIDGQLASSTALRVEVDFDKWCLAYLEFLCTEFYGETYPELEARINKHGIASECKLLGSWLDAGLDPVHAFTELVSLFRYGARYFFEDTSHEQHMLDAVMAKMTCQQIAQFSWLPILKIDLCKDGNVEDQGDSLRVRGWLIDYFTSSDLRIGTHALDTFAAWNEIVPMDWEDCPYTEVLTANSNPNNQYRFCLQHLKKHCEYLRNKFPIVAPL